MAYCPRCGTQQDPGVGQCPLCHTAVPVYSDEGPQERLWPGQLPFGPEDPSQVYATPGQLRTRVFGAVTAVFATAAATVAAVDLSLNQGFTWSPWPLAALAAVYLMTASVFAWRHQSRRWGSLWAVSVAGMLVAMDGIVASDRPWALSLGVPLVLWTSLLLAGTIASLRRAKRRGYNLFAWSFVSLGLLLNGIDFLVTWWWRGAPGLVWSGVTDLVFGPLALLFAGLHRSLRKDPDFHRIFHI